MLVSTTSHPFQWTARCKTSSGAIAGRARRLIVCILAGALALYVPIVAPAQESVTIPRAEYERLQRRAADADRLDRELQQLRSGSRQTEAAATPIAAPPAANAKGANTAAASSIASTQPVASTPSPAPSPAPYVELPTVTPVNVTAQPPLQPNEVVPAVDVMGQFVADRAAAEARYKKKWVIVRGMISEVDKELFLAPYLVIFRAANSEFRVRCEFMPPDQYSRVYMTNDKKRIIGQSDTSTKTFATVGQEVTLRGRYAGVKDGAIRFNNCESVEAPR
jgi:hypothetical protein